MVGRMASALTGLVQNFTLSGCRFMNCPYLRFPKYPLYRCRFRFMAAVLIRAAAGSFIDFERYKLDVVE
jgi:hypothetical protein